MAVDAEVVRSHTETGLGDDAINRLIADAVSAIELRAGVAGEQTVTLRGGDRYIFLPQAIASASDIATITERFGATEVTLDTDAWRWNGGRRIERLTGSGSIAPNFWGYQSGGYADDIDIVITYTPLADSDRRDRVTIDLVKLAIQFSGLSSERAGDYASSSLGDYQRERERLISELGPRLAVA